VVEVQEGERARVRAARAKVLAQVGAAKLLREQPRREPVRPLVEVAEDDARPRHPRARSTASPHELAPLMPALDEGRAEMHVEDVDYRRARLVHRHVNAQRAARLLPAPRYVVLWQCVTGRRVSTTLP
jgi:hypothetical protein